MDFEGIAWIGLAFILWASLHSLTAARPFKRWIRRRTGERAFRGFYRLSYNILSVLTILPLLYLLAMRIPFIRLWRLPAPFNLFFLAVQLVGVAGLLLSLLQTDVWRFAGVRQTLRYIAGEDDPDPPGAFVQSGTYRLVRHPLYFFSMLFIWFTPVMTMNSLLFNIMATAYFLIGAVHEERRLLGEFGERYRRYRERVPAFLPWPR